MSLRSSQRCLSVPSLAKGCQSLQLNKYCHLVKDSTRWQPNYRSHSTILIEKNKYEYIKINRLINKSQLTRYPFLFSSPDTSFIFIIKQENSEIQIRCSLRLQKSKLKFLFQFNSTYKHLIDYLL